MSASSSAPVCAYSYSAWGVCQSNGTQTRSALSKTPSTCSGDPVVSQFCVYTAGVTGNSTTAPSCSYAYAPWSECRSTGIRTRTVTSQTPSTCAGTPVVAESCVYAAEGSSVSAPACTYTYTSWISCQSSGVQMRSVVSQSPLVCAGTPVLAQSCSYTPTASSSGSATIASSATVSDFIFADISSDNSFSGMAGIKGIVAGATGVEYFLINPASNVSSSLGAAEETKENLWERSFDSTAFPNGSFYLMARVKDASGTRESARAKIVIANAAVSPAPSSVVSSPTTDTSPSTGTATTGTSAQTGTVQTTNESSLVAALTDFRGATTGKWQKLYFGSEKCEREDICGADADPDADGLTNKDEFRYNTNPLAADTDGDGLSDGREVTSGFNPLLASQGNDNDQMKYGNPKRTGSVEKNLFAVNGVEVVSSEGAADQKGLKFFGKGPANSLMNVFVYSEIPTVLAVKTDADGNWSYTLDKNLDNGEHQVYVAVTNNVGKITAKSEPLAFVKTAEAATIIPPAEAQGYENSVSPVEKRKTSDVVIALTAAMLAFLSALALIGHLLQRKKARTQDEVNASEGKKDEEFTL